MESLKTMEQELPRPLGMILATFQWIRENWLPLAAWTGVLASGYLAEFIGVFNIPVSVMSATVLGALPMLAATAIVFVMAMAVYLLLPLLPLSLTDGKGRSLLDGHLASKGRPKTLNPYRTADLFRRWMAVYVPFSGCVAGVVSYWVWQPETSGALLVGVVVCAGVLAASAFEPARRRAKAWDHNVAAFYVILGGATLLQVGGTLVVLKAVLSLTHEATWESIAHAAMVLFYTIVLIPLAQFLVAEQLKSGWTPDAMKGVVLVVLLMATIPLVSPPLGAHVASVVLQTKPKMGDPCVVAFASGRADLRDWLDISTNPNESPKQSVRLLPRAASASMDAVMSSMLAIALPLSSANGSTGYMRQPPSGLRHAIALPYLHILLALVLRIPESGNLHCCIRSDGGTSTTVNSSDHGPGFVAHHRGHAYGLPAGRRQ